MLKLRKLTLKRLNNLVQTIKFDPYDKFYTVLIDDTTTVDYCLTKVMELCMHIRTHNTVDKVKDIISIVRILLITLHKLDDDKLDDDK